MAKRTPFSTSSLPRLTGQLGLWPEQLLCSSRSDRTMAQLLFGEEGEEGPEFGHIFALPNIFPVTASTNS